MYIFFVGTLRLDAMHPSLHLHHIGWKVYSISLLKCDPLGQLILFTTRPYPASQLTQFWSALAEVYLLNDNIEPAASQKSNTKVNQVVIWRKSEWCPILTQ